MSTTAPRHRHTWQDYLDVEEMSDVRHEFLDGEIYAMAGGTPQHAALAAALVVQLGQQLRGRPCRVYGSDLRVRVRETGLATYPDAAVVCDPVETDPASPTHVTNPRALFEVLSPSTEEYDRGEKRLHYQKLSSLEEYVLLAQDRRRAEVWKRGTGGWAETVVGPGHAVALESIDCKLNLDELYEEAGLR